MNDQAIRFRIGIFVLASLIVFAVLITLFGGFPTYFRKADTYTVVFDNAQGVSPGTPVLRSGVKIGEVRSVQLDNDSGQVRVVIAIEPGYYLRRGDRPTLQRNLLGGDTSIVFVPEAAREGLDPAEESQPPGKADKPPLEGKKVERIPPGAELKGYTPPDPNQFMQRVAELIGPAEEMLIEIRRVFRQLDKMSPAMREALEGFRDLARSGKELSPELQKTNVELRELAKAVRGAVPGFEKASIELGDLAKTIRGAMPTFEKTSDQIRELAKASRDVVPEFRRTNEEAQAAVRTWGRVGERTEVFIQTNEKALSRSIAELQEVLKRTAEALNDENLRNARDILRNARIASERLDSIARGTDETLKDTRVALKQLTESLRRADVILFDIQKLTGPFSERVPGLYRNVDEAAQKLNLVLTDVRDLLRVIGQSDGTIQRLLTDPSIYNNLNDATYMAMRLVPRVDQILRDFGIFADKLARHPEAIGLGGVVRPSSGLKEAPSAVYPWRLAPHHP
jgi:phospholipid/cholesterol/gamma-HCH transport system substrate-binding protein